MRSLTAHALNDDALNGDARNDDALETSMALNRRKGGRGIDQKRPRAPTNGVL